MNSLRIRHWVRFSLTLHCRQILYLWATYEAYKSLIMLITLPNVYKYTRVLFSNLRHTGIPHAHTMPAGNNWMWNVTPTIFLVEYHIGYSCLDSTVYFCQPICSVITFGGIRSWICCKVKEFQKNIIHFYFIDYAKPLSAVCSMSNW